MRHSVIPAIAAALLLSACATPQENPHYRFSSVYDLKSDQARGEMASYRTVAPAARAPLATDAPSGVYTRVAPGCVDAGSCAPQGLAETKAPTVAEPWASPTEERFAGGDTTPGFRAVAGSLGGTPAPAPAPEASVEAAPMPTPAAPADPSDDPYSDYLGDGTPTLTISGPIVAAEALVGTQSRAVMHRVEAGDTVYSLSRDYCTSVSAIQSLNGLGDDYAIGLGADLKVPAGCR